MIIDVILAALVLMLTFIGWRSGALASLARWGAVIAAATLSGPLGSALAPEVAPWLPDHPQLVRPAATLVAGVGLLVVGLIVASVVVRFVRLVKLVAHADRLLGLVLGLAKGLLLAYLLAAFCVLLDRPLRKAFPAFGSQLDASLSVGIAREVNLLEEVFETLPEPPKPPKPAGLPAPPTKLPRIPPLPDP